MDMIVKANLRIKLVAFETIFREAFPFIYVAWIIRICQLDPSIMTVNYNSQKYLLPFSFIHLFYPVDARRHLIEAWWNLSSRGVSYYLRSQTRLKSS